MRRPSLKIETTGIDSLIVRLFDDIQEDNMPWLLAADRQLRAHFGEHLIDLVPSYTTLLVHYDLLALDLAQAHALINEALQGLEPDTGTTGQRHVIPVWYDRSVGPDLQRLAEAKGLGESQVVDLHGSRDYQVFALGFAPGFAFMGLVEERLAMPRISTPRKRIAPGSVGIADRQTAIYPSISPGGWNLLGRTPTRLFDRDMDGYSLLQPGDRVRFAAIDHAEFVRLGGDDTPLEAQP